MAILNKEPDVISSFFIYRLNVSDSSVLEVLHWYTCVNAALLDHLTNQIKETDNSGVWRYDVFCYIQSVSRL
jgi:hypothetical protein